MTTWAVSGFLSAAFLAGSFFILREIFNLGFIAAIFVALVNAVLPLVIRILTLSIGQFSRPFLPPHPCVVWRIALQQLDWQASRLVHTCRRYVSYIVPEVCLEAIKTCSVVHFKLDHYYGVCVLFEVCASDTVIKLACLICVSSKVCYCCCRVLLLFSHCLHFTLYTRVSTGVASMGANHGAAPLAYA